MYVYIVFSFIIGMGIIMFLNGRIFVMKVVERM